MSLQLLIILAYFAITLAVGFLAKTKTRSATSFHGAGLGVLMVVVVGVGEWLGGTSTTGIAEYGFIAGLSGAWYTIANGIGVMVLALFFAKLYRSLDTVTVPGIVEKFLGLRARTVASVLLIFVMIAVGTAQVIAAGTLGVSVLGLSYHASVIILGLGFIVYTLAGGMTAVGYTNLLHLIAMYGGAVLAVAFVLGDIGGLASLKSHLPAHPYFSWTGIGWPAISSWIIASILGACTAQAGIQPILAAKDVRAAQQGALITALLVAPFGILTALLGMAAKVRFPELANAKLALPTLMMHLHPVVGGIVLASIMAAILSTVAPIILAAGTMFTKDLYQCLWRPAAGDQQLLLVSRLSTGAAGLLCLLLALLMYGSTRILDMVYFAYTIRGSLFVILLFAIYWRRTSPQGAVYGMIVTALAGFFWVFYKSQFGRYPLHPDFTETYAALVVAVLSTVLLSFVDKRPERQHASQTPNP
ncbi:MAG: sodium:solute symporter family protein [Thermoanaerobacteraceae bacterium]|nr:sodium:solute symporter family protein [Thermoanaerobacteraceae bacterium]